MKMCTKINTDIFDPQPEILKTYIVRRMILNAAGKAKDITERHIRSVMDLSGPGGGTCHMVSKRCVDMRH
jgi:tRNA(Ile)-lysidine synthase